VHPLARGKWDGVALDKNRASINRREMGVGRGLRPLRGARLATETTPILFLSPAWRGTTFTLSDSHLASPFV